MALQLPLSFKSGELSALVIGIDITGTTLSQEIYAFSIEILFQHVYVFCFEFLNVLRKVLKK